MVIGEETDITDGQQHHPKHPDEVAEAITDKEDAYGELRHELVHSRVPKTCD